MLTNTRNLTTEQENEVSCGKIFWLMLAVFYALFVIRNVFSVEFSISYYLIWIAVMALIFNDTETKALIISFIPLAPGFQSKYAVLVCMVILLIKHCKRLRIPLFVFIILLLMFWEFLHLEDEYSTIDEYLSGFAPLMCLAIVVSIPTKNEDVSFFSRVLAVSLAVGSLILIASTVNESHQSIFSLMQEGFRLGVLDETEDYRIAYNSNLLGFLCNMVVAGLLTNIYLKKSKKIDYFLMAFAVLVGCLTVSRTFLLCLAGTIALYVVFQKNSVIHKVRVLLIFAFVFSLALLILKIAAPDIIENYIVRFSAEDVTGGRTYLYNFYNDFIADSPKHFWYGIGVQNINLKVGNMKGVTVNVPHNGYQQLIVAWGVVGLLLMMVFIIFLALYAKKKNPKVPFMCCLPLILLLVNILAGQFVTSGTKLLSLIYIYLMICNGGKGALKV